MQGKSLFLSFFLCSPSLSLSNTHTHPHMHAHVHTSCAVVLALFMAGAGWSGTRMAAPPLLFLCDITLPPPSPHSRTLALSALLPCSCGHSWEFTAALRDSTQGDGRDSLSPLRLSLHSRQRTCVLTLCFPAQQQRWMNSFLFVWRPDNREQRPRPSRPYPTPAPQETHGGGLVLRVWRLLSAHEPVLLG